MKAYKKDAVIPHYMGGWSVRLSQSVRGTINM
jgi:hypothetical protein